MLIGLSILWYLIIRTVLSFKLTKARSADKGP